MSEDENRALFEAALTHHQAGRLDEAMRDYQALLARNPRVAAAHNNFGMLLEASGQYAAAEKAFREALDVRPEYPEALVNLGALLRNLNREEEALNVYLRAAALRPDDHRLLMTLGDLLVRHDRSEEAIVAYRAAAQLRPGDAETCATLLNELQNACDWRTIAVDERRVLEFARTGQRGVPPLLLHATGATLAEQQAYAAMYAPVSQAALHRPVQRGERIRIGYLSGHYHTHPTPLLIAGMLELHDRAQFEVIGYSVGEADDSEMRRRIEKAFDRFVDLEKLPNAEAAARIASDQVDILIDVSGYTRFGRTGVFAYRPAPVQVNYLAYPGTMGAPYIDYIIADRDLIRDDEHRYYTEKVVLLPESYQPNDHTRPIAATKHSRAACGLPEKAFVFCSFNRPSKITPEVFDVWMSLLRDVPEAVLWLVEFNLTAVDNLRREAAARGVQPERLVFAPFVPSAENLARLRNADLFLDTLPYNAHTTMSDALWSGLPAVTCRGDTFAARVGASLLRAAGLPELITDSLDDYAALALALARDPDRLDAAFAKLESPGRLPLFDSVRYTRGIERAYVRMAELSRAGRAPEAFSV